MIQHVAQYTAMLINVHIVVLFEFYVYNEYSEYLTVVKCTYCRVHFGIFSNDFIYVYTIYSIAESELT